MTDNAHAAGPPPQQLPNQPSLAEKAKTLTWQGGHSSLASQSVKHPGFPFSSVMPYGLTDRGEPTFLVSSMATHTKNVLADPRATLLIVQASGTTNSLGDARISIMGNVRPVTDDAELQQVRGGYLERNPSARSWEHFGDFRYFRLEIVDIYFVGGFGVMGWIDAETFRAAQPDPLVDVAQETIDHLNRTQAPQLAELARRTSDLVANAAEVTALDRLGMHLRVQTPDGWKGLRVAFPSSVASPDALPQVLVELLPPSRQD